VTGGGLHHSLTLHISSSGNVTRKNARHRQSSFPTKQLRKDNNTPEPNKSATSLLRVDQTYTFPRGPHTCSFVQPPEDSICRKTLAQWSVGCLLSWASCSGKVWSDRFVSFFMDDGHACWFCACHKTGFRPAYYPLRAWNQPLLLASTSEPTTINGDTAALTWHSAVACLAVGEAPVFFEAAGGAGTACTTCICNHTHNRNHHEHERTLLAQKEVQNQAFVAFFLPWVFQYVGSPPLLLVPLAMLFETSLMCAMRRPPDRGSARTVYLRTYLVLVRRQVLARRVIGSSRRVWQHALAGWGTEGDVVGLGNGVAFHDPVGAQARLNIHIGRDTRRVFLSSQKRRRSSRKAIEFSLVQHLQEGCRREHNSRLHGHVQPRCNVCLWNSAASILLRTWSLTQINPSALLARMYHVLAGDVRLC